MSSMVFPGQKNRVYTASPFDQLALSAGFRQRIGQMRASRASSPGAARP